MISAFVFPAFSVSWNIILSTHGNKLCWQNNLYNTSDDKKILLEHIYIYIYIGLGSIQNWSKLPENKFLYSIKISPINKPHLFLCVCLVAVHSYVTSNGKSRNSRRAFTATPPCLCACVTSNRGFDSWGSFSLWKYPHLQAVLCFHRLTARLEWHQLLLEQEKVRNKKNNFNTQASSWVTHCHDQMAYVQTDPHVKDFLITSFIDGTTETVSLCPCDSLVEEHREPAFIEFCCGESCVCVCLFILLLVHCADPDYRDIMESEDVVQGIILATETDQTRSYSYQLPWSAVTRQQRKKRDSRCKNIITLNQ